MMQARSLRPVLNQNARCNLRQVARFQLFAEKAGQPVEVALPNPVPLYETDRNDDDHQANWIRGHESIAGLIGDRAERR